MDIIKRLLIAAFLTFVLAIAVVPSFRNHIFFLNFVDEDDNIVIGNFASEGKKLYTDVYTQHQPIPFIISATIQKIAQPQNILMTVKRHREFVIIWSLIWIFILSIRFGFPLFITGAAIELVKINLLGNLYLAESLVIYPMLYVVAYFTYVQPEVTKWEPYFIAILIWFLFFSLAPIWPLLVAIMMWWVYQSKNKIRISTLIIYVGIIYSLLLFGNGTFRDYWNDAIFINYKYYVPFTTRISLAESLSKSFFAPLYSLVNQNQSMLLGLIKIFSLGLVVEIFWLIKDKLYGRAITWIILLWLCNIRYIDPSTTLYGAFHMLPWLSILMFVTITECVRLIYLRRYHYFSAAIILVMIIATTLSIAKSSLYDKRDPATDYYVHYSPSADIAKAVSIMSQSEPQTLWVEPVQYWPYWKTGAKQYSEMVNYYGWMDQTKPMKESIEAQFNSELPTIVWADTTLGIGNYLSSYTRFKRDGKPINLYLRKDKIGRIDKQTWEQLDYYRFKIN